MFLYGIFFLIYGTQNVISTDVICLDKTKINEDVCSNAVTGKEILQDAETLTVALQQSLRNAQQKYLDVEKTACSLTSEGFISGNNKCLDAPTSCDAIQKKLNIKKSGVYRIWPRYLKHPINVYCDMDTDNGGWTVIQRRADLCGVCGQKENFYRTYEDYRKGFGNVSGEFWLGNDALFALTNQEETTLRFDLEDFEGNRKYAVYSTFEVGSTKTKYQLKVKGYSGDAGDSMELQNGQVFSAFDIEGNDGACARLYKGGWWYNQPSCHHSNLNGLYFRGHHSSYADGVNWYSWKGHYYSLKFTEMKIRPTA